MNETAGASLGPLSQVEANPLETGILSIIFVIPLIVANIYIIITICLLKPKPLYTYIANWLLADSLSVTIRYLFRSVLSNRFCISLIRANVLIYISDFLEFATIVFITIIALYVFTQHLVPKLASFVFEKFYFVIVLLTWIGINITVIATSTTLSHPTIQDQLLKSLRDAEFALLIIIPILVVLTLIVKTVKAIKKKEQTVNNLGLSLVTAFVCLLYIMKLMADHLSSTNYIWFGTVCLLLFHPVVNIVLLCLFDDDFKEKFFKQLSCTKKDDKKVSRKAYDTLKEVVDEY